MSCSSHPESCKQWTVCFDCMFSLSIWFELRCDILKKLNINFPVDSTKNKSSLKPSKPTSSVKMSPVRQSRRRSLNVDPALLKKHLEHLKSVKQVSRKLNCDDSIEDDKKMYKDIPYVLVVTDNKQQQKPARRISTTAKSKAKPKPKSKQSNNSSLTNSVKTVIERRSSRIKPIEVIELSDTDSEGKDHKENKKPTRTRPTRAKPTKAKPANAKTQKQSIAKPKSAKQVKKVKSRLSLRTKSPFKIRLSSKFILPPETVEQKQTYTCSICDKRFNVNCMYKVHKLWHEKPEAIIINVTRHDFSDHLKKRESNSNKLSKKKFRIISDINVANAISKESEVIDEQSDIDDSTRQPDVDSSENDEETADSSNKEQGEVQRKESDSSDDVKQNGTLEAEETETGENQTEKSSLEEKNSAVAENECAEESSQEVDAVHDKETTEINDEEHNEEQDVGDKEEVEDDFQKETEEDESDSQEMEKNKDTTEEDNEMEVNHADEITKNGKSVENDDEENDEQEVQDVQEAEDNDISFTDEENESENDYSNNKRNSIDDKVEIIEKQLAVLHGESENEHDEPENDEESNGQDEPENDETENCEPLELKRKRVSNSDVSDSEENAERVTPKTKRVRFATDFNMPNDEPLDLNISNNYSEERNENLRKSWCSI